MSRSTLLVSDSLAAKGRQQGGQLVQDAIAAGRTLLLRLVLVSRMSVVVLL